MAKAIAKTAAIAVAAGLTFAGSAGIATDAIAQTTNTAAVSTAPGVPDASDITADEAKLTIHKRVNPTELRPANGAADDGASGAGLAGVGFTAERINADITNQDEFNKVAKLANDRDIAGAEALKADASNETDAPKTFTFENTDANGETSLTLPVGAYIIREQTPAADTTEAYVPADPFIVFLPMTNEKGTGWNTDVHVYPKNSMAKVTKTVVDAGKNIKSDGKGEEGKPGYLGARKADNAVVNYTLDGLVPAAPEGRVLKNVTLTDASNSAELQWATENNAFIEGVYVVRDGSEVAIDAANYTVNSTATVPTTNTGTLAAGADQAFTVTVDAKKAGLKPGETVRVKVKATMLKDDTKSKGIENSVRESFVLHNQKTDKDDEPRETPDDKVVTYVGNISVYKRGDNNEALAGAEFQIGKCNSGKDGIAGDVIQTGITDKEGNLTFPGLHVTDYVNNAEDTVANYCVQETKAPDGYALPKGKNAVHEIELKRATSKALNAEKTAFDAAAAENVIANGAVIDNVKKTTPTLPATGGMGVLIIVLAGLAIIGGGVYAARRNSQAA